MVDNRDELDEELGQSKGETEEKMTLNYFG